jgi:AcrR family transcriptional regulator
VPELRQVYSVVSTRDKIIDAALAVFSEIGFQGATIREIAQRAEVSQGLIHHHFKDKGTLWRVVAERISSDYVEHVTPVLNPAEIDGETAPRLLKAYMSFWKERPMALRFWLWRLLSGTAEERRDHDEQSLCVGTLKRVQDAGFLRTDIPAWLAMVTAGGLIQYFLHNQSLPETGEDGRIGEINEDRLLEYVSSLIAHRPPEPPATKSPG